MLGLGGRVSNHQAGLHVGSSGFCFTCTPAGTARRRDAVTLWKAASKATKEHAEVDVHTAGPASPMYNLTFLQNEMVIPLDLAGWKAKMAKLLVT